MATSDTTPAGCASGLALVISFVVGAPLSAFVLRTTWRWFIVADFGARPLTWHAALGLGLVVAYLTKQHDPNDKRTSWRMLGDALLVDVVALAMAGIYHVASRGIAS